MNLIKSIKEYFLFKKTLSTFQRIDITEAMKHKLSAFDEEVVQFLYEQTLDKIGKEMVKEEVGVDFYKGAKFSAYFFKSFFKNYYNITK